MDNKNKIRTDWEITILEGQRYHDVFNEINLPTRPPGITSMHIVVPDVADFGVFDFIYESMVEWGFIDCDMEPPLLTCNKIGEVDDIVDVDGITIYTL
jgi:hypothetical protein